MTAKTTHYQSFTPQSTNIGGYRYFFNGQEGNNEVFGEVALHAFEYRMHDARLGRFWSVDPLAAKYPWNSTYAFCENTPIWARELEGLEKWITQTSQLTFGPYSLEYVTENNYRPLQDVIQSSHLINAVESAQKSQTFTSLQTTSDLVSFTVTNNDRGTWTRSGTRQINIDSRANSSEVILGMAWEMTNASNVQRLLQLENKASEGKISKEEYVMGKLEIESEALVNQIIIADELELQAPFANEFKDDIKSIQNGTMERQNLIDKITQYGYSNASTTLPDGTTTKVSDAYGKQYDSLQSKK